ncbi:YlbF family regulator [Haloarchaeobius sp. HME9146]|uniref:YlbF family regulator n=1 Tax=unclassified Haloarchaeobius TaxID=2614452 RepID=UPI0021BE46A0|nr:YlbF family regulator [Haloarchaeobius sp. HME9146]MCT9096206.1 YlbF family regulator [Haloarchaeobius sp. HME9146]
MSIETSGDAAEETTVVDQRAQELGEAIRDLPEFERFHEAQQAVEESEEAQEKIDEFEQVRQEFMLARQTGQASQEDLQNLQETQQELHDIPVMAEYIDAQNRLDARLEAVNDTLSETIGLDFADEASGCCND